MDFFRAKELLSALADSQETFERSEDLGETR